MTKIALKFETGQDTRASLRRTLLSRAGKKNNPGTGKTPETMSPGQTF